MWATEYGIDTTVSPERIWRAWSDVARWPEWNADIERIELRGGFGAGGTIVMTPRGQGAVLLRIAELVEGELFVDEAVVAGTTVRTMHRLVRQGDGRTRIVYRMQATGPAEAAIGPAISADFGDTLAALTEYAAR